MERVRRLTGDRIPERHALSEPLTPDQVRSWGRFAETSPLYAHLIEVIASDDELMRVSGQIEHTPQPNLLFAGVQYLMARHGGGDLERHYPNFGGSKGVAGVDAPFRDFVLAHEDELVDIGRTRYTQTNECRRCVALLPAIWLTRLDRFNLVDLGASAGLNLHLDRYHYSWDGLEWGPKSEVRLETESRGVPVVPRDIEVATRIGLDLNPIDPTDADARLWLDSLIWPEHHDRRRRLRAALMIAAREPVRSVAGNALETLGPTLSALPRGEPVVLMHAFALNQVAEEGRGQIDEIIDRGRETRDIHRVAFESMGSWDGNALIVIDDGSGPVEVGRAQPHGEWVELYARP